MSRDGYSNKSPYLEADEYANVERSTYEREKFDPSAPEREESQFKKPYLFDRHPDSERMYTPPGGYRPPPPDGPIGPINYDCQPQGNAIGGGPVDWCLPSIKCGAWDFSCAHRIIGFRAIGGSIQSQTYSGDTVRVIACWDETMHGLSVIGTLNNGNMVTVDADKGECVGPGHDPECIDCETCENKDNVPQYTIATHQINVSASITISAYYGGGGPYTWTLVSGGGTLNKRFTRADENVTYTAPATNPECALNPVIKLEDYCHLSRNIYLAVNAVTTSDVAYRIVGYSCTGGVCTIASSDWGCANQYLDASRSCATCQATCGTGCDLCSTGCDPNYPACTQSCMAANCCTGPAGVCHSCAVGTHDVRTAEQKTAGCCPYALI